MGKFKVGDKVRVRGWEDMAKEFGVNLIGYIECSPAFVDNMRCYCGGVYKILGDTSVSYVLEGAGGYVFPEETLFPAITYREYMQENYPDLTGDVFIGGVFGCPGWRGFCDFKFAGQCGKSGERCAECWDQYMTEAEYKKYVLKEEEEKEMFKVGDYVKVVKPVGGRTVSWITGMDLAIGRVFKISKVDSDNTCQLEGADSVWFPFEALEPATPKDMLYPFCTVKMRNGDVYLFDGKNKVINKDGHVLIGKHDENLNASLNSKFDVMDICAPSNYITELSELLTDRGECIWKREEVVEITAEEAAKKLSEQYPGQTIKIVC